MVWTSGTLARVCAVVDSTCLVLPHNPKKEERKKNFHFRCDTKQALKWQLCVTPDGMPWHISQIVHGSNADIKLLQQFDVMDLTPRWVHPRR
jgi:hypothetical protein